MKFGKILNGWEGLYQVSNLGRVKSLNKIIKYHYNFIDKTTNRTRIVQGRILKPNVSNGYFQVTLSGQEHKTKQASIHRLVAEAFIPNPDCLPQVNHKDENKLNNEVSNLEWCTQDYNAKYSASLHPGRYSKIMTNNPKRSYPVLCVETGITYPSTAEAARQTRIKSGEHI